MRHALFLVMLTLFTGCEAYDLYRMSRPIDNTVPHGDQCLGDKQGDYYRCWDIAVPDTLPAGPVPLVVDLHGWWNRPANQREFSRYHELAVEESFIAVWPYGIDWSWNGGGNPWPSDTIRDELEGEGCCGHALNQGIDDVDFIRRMVAQVREEHDIDDARIFVTGFSNGCFLAQRLATEVSDVFDGVACMAGYVYVDAPTDYTPIPVLEVHGTEDETALYEPGYWPGAVGNFDTWRERNACTGEPTEVWREGEHTMLQADGCANDASVALITLLGAGHQVYGGQDGVEIDTARMAWDFLISQAAR